MLCIPLISKSNGTECQNGKYALQKHSTVSDGLRILFLIELLGRRTGRNQRMEPGDRTARNRRKQDREQHLNTIAIIHCKTGKSRECIHGRMCTDHAESCNDKHRIKQERAQVITGLQQDPHRRNRCDRNVNTYYDHPGLCREIDRMEIHAYYHADNNGCHTQDGRNQHGSISAVNRKSKNNGDQNE